MVQSTILACIPDLSLTDCVCHITEGRTMMRGVETLYQVRT